MITNPIRGDTYWVASHPDVRAGKGIKQITVTGRSNFDSGEVATVKAGRSTYWPNELFETEEEALRAALSILLHDEWRAVTQHAETMSKINAARAALEQQS